MFRKEIDPYSLNLQFGWYGNILLLFLAQKTFNESFPNYERLGKLRCELISKYKEKSEKEIELVQYNTQTKPLGLVDGLVGIGLFYLLCPEALKE